MAQVRKPIPKTPAQEVQDKIVPYELADYGKEPMVSKPNRANDVSQKGSREKNFSVKLIDIDTAIIEHIKNNIKPTVYSNTELIDVPVIYAFPERWVAMQREGFLRDVSGKIIAPLIVINRTDIEKNRKVGRNLDSNLAQNLHVFQKQFTSKNAYTPFDIINNRIPVKEMMVVAHPDYVTITYEVNIYADFVEQLNRIIEAIQYAENSYWGDKNRYYFRVNIDSFPTSVQFAAEEERTVTSKMTVKLFGYLIPDTVNAFMSHNMEYISKGSVVFNEEILTSNLDEDMNLTQPQQSPTAMDAAYITYLNTNTQRLATITDPDRAFVNGIILKAPPGLPPTNKTNFDVYINGKMEDSRYFEIEATGNTIIFIFDTVSMGYTLNFNDNVLIVGKFT